MSVINWSDIWPAFLGPVGAIAGMYKSATAVLDQADAYAYSGVERPPAAAAPTAPETLEQLTVNGAWTPDQAIAGGWEKTLQQYLDFFAAQDERNKADQSSKTKDLLYIAAALAAGGLVLWFVKGK